MENYLLNNLFVINVISFGPFYRWWTGIYKLLLDRFAWRLWLDGWLGLSILFLFWYLLIDLISFFLLILFRVLLRQWFPSNGILNFLKCIFEKSSHRAECFLGLVSNAGLLLLTLFDFFLLLIFDLLLLLFNWILFILRRLLPLSLLAILLCSCHFPSFYILLDRSILSHQCLMPP